MEWHCFIHFVILRYNVTIYCAGALEDEGGGGIYLYTVTIT